MNKYKTKMWNKRPEWWLNILRMYWPLNTSLARIMNKPVIGAVLRLLFLPLFKKKNFHITYIPVNARIEAAQSLVLTESILERLVKESAYRVIIRRCSCRDSKKCAHYPVEDSCLLMGEDTRHVDERIAKHVTVDEALEHVRKMVGLGLIPMTGRVRMDDFYYGIPNRGRMLTTCFCCPCCCSVLNTAQYMPGEVKPNIVKMEGLNVSFDSEKCQACGKCAEVCFTGARKLVNGIAVYDERLCIGCGHCSTVCPRKAVSLSMTDADAGIKTMLSRVQNAVKVD